VRELERQGYGLASPAVKLATSGDPDQIGTAL
jgi:hypothetical protein